MDLFAFSLAAVSLLATPGPTNTLLATSAAAVGARRSVQLLPAELTGYFVSILILRGLLGPVIAASPLLKLGLHAAVALYLLYLAAMLWRHGSGEAGDKRPITILRVFVTTLLNPKAVIFAFALLPEGLGILDLRPWLTVLAIEIAAAGSGWIVVGTVLRRGFSGVLGPRVGYRLSATVLVLLAGVLGVHALA